MSIVEKASVVFRLGSSEHKVSICRRIYYQLEELGLELPCSDLLKIDTFNGDLIN